MRLDGQDESKFNIKKIIKFFSKDDSPVELESDDDLAFEADKSGMIHVRKSKGETKVLPGYGTTDFGVSSFETKENRPVSKMLIGGALLASGIYISTQFRTLTDYALLLRESMKED